MNWIIDILFMAVLMLAYTWIGYPVLLWLLRFARGRNVAAALPPSFSVIVAAHNEESRIEGKLQDCLALDYAGAQVEIIVASDGSTDSTELIVEQWAQRNECIRLLRTTERAGKSGAQNLAASQARGDILLFTDAETRTQPDLLERIASDFADPEVGLVAPVVQFGRFDSAVSHSQGAYWRFEIWLRQMESDLGILATASGAAFAIRKELFRTIPPQFGDDCVTPLDVRLQGFKILQDPHAVVSDEMPHSVEGELRARVRMTARNWSGILSRPELLNPWKFPGTAWSLISHKFLRWMTPFFLLAALLANAILAIDIRWAWLLLLQLSFYSAALIGWKRSESQACERIFGFPFAFCLANVGFLLGVVCSLRGQSVIAYK